MDPAWIGHRILSAKTTVSVVWSNTSGCFPGALNTQLWNCAMFLSLCLPCWQKGTSLFSYCFKLLMILQNLKCLWYIVPLIWKHLFNLLYLISLWYNFLDQSLWGKNKNKTLGHVPDSFTVSSASFQPQGRSRWTAGDAGGNKHGSRCWTPSAHQMFCLEMKCFSETHVDSLVLNVAVLRGDWIWGSDLLTRWIRLWIDRLILYRAGTVIKPSALSIHPPPLVNTMRSVDLLCYGLPDVLP